MLVTNSTKKGFGAIFAKAEGIGSASCKGILIAVEQEVALEKADRRNRSMRIPSLASQR